jgi:hypothetical protein
MYSIDSYRPSYVVDTPGINTLKYADSDYAYDSINLDFIATFLDCFTYNYRRPTDQPSRTALFYQQVEYILSSDN